MAYWINNVYPYLLVLLYLATRGCYGAMKKQCHAMLSYRNLAFEQHKDFPQLIFFFFLTLNVLHRIELFKV